MQRRVCLAVLAGVLQALSNDPGPLAQNSAERGPAAPLNDARATSMRREPVLLPVRWEAKTGKLYLGVPLSAKDGTISPTYILSSSLPYGVGQNDLGLDRGQLSPLSGINSADSTRLVHFERAGPKLLLVQENTVFRTASADPAEQAAVSQSFPASVLAGFKVDGEAEGFVVVDATEYFLGDVHGVSEALAAAGQGRYRVDKDRSTVVTEQTKGFPENTEVESALTLVTDDPSKANLVADVTPDAHAVTVHERQSFLKLPPPGFVPRRFSPRAGYFDLSYREMNAPLGDDVNQRWITRFRLQKRDPACRTNCEAVKPIHYYVDRGAPEPIRSALIEGCRWWDQAFQAAGWAPGTFLVDPLPEGADARDVRYNVIQWVHRYNRGWSYGSEIADPRTGEILKGNVVLGSLRGRQDYLIAEALLAPYRDGQVPEPSHDPALAMVLERLRQLAAHETGHTLGLAHNFAASSMPHSPDETMSVMDYPHPWVTVGAGGVPDLREAYPAGIGVWDKVAIDYGYRELDRGGKPVEDGAALDAILHTAESKGIVYLTDQDARSPGSASPIAHLWDNGTDAADELTRILAVRAAALERFGPDVIRPGTPMAQMEETLAPLYLFHRYQTEAAIKMIGGLDYRYTVRGDGQAGPGVVPANTQRKALAAVARTLSPEVLVLPERLLRLFPPRPPGLSRTVESLPSHTAMTFDPVASAEGAADLTLGVLFQPARANRLMEDHARDATQPTLSEVIRAAFAAATAARDAGEMQRLVSEAVEARVLEALFRLEMHPQTTAAAKSVLLEEIHEAGQRADSAYLKNRIAEFERRPDAFKVDPVVEVPPGMPIGDDEVM